MFERPMSTHNNSGGVLFLLGERGGFPIATCAIAWVVFNATHYCANRILFFSLVTRVEIVIVFSFVFIYSSTRV